MISELNTTAVPMSEGSAVGPDASMNEVASNSMSDSSDEDVLYMRGASFTIHFDPRTSNSSDSRQQVAYDDDANEIPEEEKYPARVSLRFCLTKKKYSKT